MNFRVRFHLGAGAHFMHWQVISLHTGEVRYFDPSQYTFHLTHAKLRNQPATAQKIHSGANKTVCAWIDCEGFAADSISSLEIEQSCIERDMPGIWYNPRIAPFWRDAAGLNIDNSTHPELFVANRSIFQILSSCQVDNVEV